MDFPKWVPVELAEVYAGLIDAERDFMEASYSVDTMTRHAQKNRFNSWPAMRSFLVAYRECLGRLSSDLAAKEIWEWVSTEKARRYLLSAISQSMKEWYCQPKMTAKELENDYAEIADLARRLSGKLAMHHGDPVFNFIPRALIPDSYRADAALALHPKLVMLAESKGLPKDLFIGAGLPPLFVLLLSLADKIDNAKPVNRSRKIKTKSNSAFRQSVLNTLCTRLYQYNQVQESNTKMASLLALICDDDEITDATVRGDLKVIPYGQTQ